MKRVVLDTNVTVSAFFWKGHPRTIYDFVRSKKITMLLSSDMEKEEILIIFLKNMAISWRLAMKVMNVKWK